MKKVLSLAIALAMTIGLVSAFSASATSATVLKASDAIGNPGMYVEWCASAESHMENGVKVTSADVMEDTYCYVAMARADVVNTPYLVIKFDEATLASNDPNTLVRIYDGYTGGTEVINNLRIGDATTDVMCFDLREYINCGGNMPEVVSLYVMLLDIAPGSTVAFESMYFTDTIPADDNTGDDTPDFAINDDAIAVGKPWAEAATSGNYDSVTDVSVSFVTGNNSIWAWQAGTVTSAVLQLDEAAVSNIESIVFANKWGEPANKMSITPEVGKILIDFEALAAELPAGIDWYYVEITVKADSTAVLPAFYLTNERAVSDDDTNNDNTGDDDTNNDNTNNDNTGDDTEAPDTGDVSVALPVALALTTLLVAAVVLKKKATR